jgi:AhpD family alkylhydroperoxidase
MKYRKRLYKSPKAFFADLSFQFKHRKVFRKMKEKDLIPPFFQERLMLAVTGVNECRYCSYFHAGQALKSGISQEEIDMLLASTIESCPDEEKVALMYAQHWAETDAHPDPEALQELQKTYGPEKTEAIHVILRMIRMGNLLGNSFDYFLYLLSCGRLGN